MDDWNVQPYDFFRKKRWFVDSLFVDDNEGSECEDKDGNIFDVFNEESDDESI